MSNFIRKLSLNPKSKRHDDTKASSRDASPTSTDSKERMSTAAASATSDHVDSITRKSNSVTRVDGDSDKSPSGKKKTLLPFELMSMPKAISHKLHGDSSPSRSSSDLAPRSEVVPKNRDGHDMSKNQLRKHKQHTKEEQKATWQERQTAEFKKRRERMAREAESQDSPEMRAHYGWLPVNGYGGDWRESRQEKLADVANKSIGDSVFFRARIHNNRNMSSKLAFLIFRQQTETIQGVLVESPHVSSFMIHWAEHIPTETIVQVKGVLQKPKAKEGEVLGTEIHDKEVLVQDLHIVSKMTEHIPFSVVEAEVSQMEADAEGSTRHHVGDRSRLNARIIDLRTTTSQAIFRVQSGVCHFFRDYLDGQNFIEIHSPKLQGGATESGASVFKVEYFGRTAFLAQSPQLAKQMSIAADFGRVYEIGAVFRAENSNTHRHLTEYTGLDLEMAIDEHYHEMLRIVDNTLKHIFEGIYKRFKPEIELVKRQFPHEDLVWLDKTPVLPFREAIQLLNDSGWKGENGKPLPLDEDLGTRDEIQMGKVIKEKYKTDYYILDKFPTSARPFYTMPDAEDSNYTNSFDVFVRGQEIISGGERIHDASMLVDKLKSLKMDPSTMDEYLQGFEWAAPPHAGAGIGLERIVMLLLQLGDIRHASMYPRDPRSLPAKPPAPKLRHPEASTLHPPWEGRYDKTTAHEDLQLLEHLIANYGDASNTSWLEDRFVIWRDGETGAAVGYVPHNGFAIAVGDPLCHDSQYAKVIASYLDYIKQETSLSPLWLLCGHRTNDVLGERFDWRTFSCAGEQRMDLEQGSISVRSFNNNDIQRKIRHAEKEGVKVTQYEIGSPPPKEMREKCDKRIQDWLGGRKEHQHVHLTDVHPWQDIAHRQYHIASASDGTVVAMVILAQLSWEHGWQVKFSLDFPQAPNGAVEMAVIHALKAVQAKGETKATFGGGASHEFRVGHNLKGAKVKMLAKAYSTIANDLKLTQKSEFREKLGAQEDPIYVCYPPKGLGPKGVRAILSFFEQ